MRSLNRIAALALLAALLAPPALARNDNASANEIAVAALPREAQQTLQSIKRGGPFGYERDGVVFGNYERRLPPRQRGYYREYTVPTPGVRNRGARRIVAGAGAEYYYSDDHYRSFRRIRE
jgi:ribonuclease T1